MKLVYFAYKIKDGLYIGNQRAPTEQEFLNVNKITHILNCASKQIEIQFPNLLSLPFDDSDEQVIVTEENMSQIYEFLEKANELGEGVLICSYRGQSRALTVLTAYFMKKQHFIYLRYYWGLYKTLQFLNQRRKDFEIRGSFLRQLIQFEKIIFKNKKQSTGWENSNETPEGLILRNTYLNSLIQAIDDDKLLTKGLNQTVGWSENLVELLDESNLRQNTNINNRSILKSGGRRRLAKFYQKSSAPEEDFKVLEQNILIKYTTPKVQDIKFVPKQQQSVNQGVKNNSFQKVKRSPSPLQYIYPQQKPNAQTQQLMNIYLDQTLLPLQLRKNVSPLKQRVRSISQQTQVNRVATPIKRQLLNSSKTDKKQIPLYRLK